jgi:hypothetical protein
MKNKRLILHIGLPKTGSTSFQATLRQASENNLLESVEYPLIDSKMFYEQIESGNAGRLGHYVRHTKIADLDSTEVERRFLEIENARKFPDRALLLSYEGFWPAKEENLNVLRDVFKQYDYDLEMLCSVRNFPDLWRSALSQHIRHHYTTPSALETLNLYVKRSKYWLAGDFPVQIVAHKNDVLSAMYTAIGENPAIISLVKSSRLNEKLTSSEALLLGRIRNVVAEPVQTMIRISNELRYQDQTGVLRDPERQQFILEANRGLEAPESWRLEESMMKLEQIHAEASTSTQKFFWQCLLDCDSTLDINVENTPALIAVGSNTEPTLQEWDVVVSSFSEIIQRTESHSANIEARLKALEPNSRFSSGAFTRSGSPFSQMYSHNLGFDVMHYLAINPDVDSAETDAYQHYLECGIHENRHTRLSMRSEERRVPDSCLILGANTFGIQSFQEDFNNRFQHTLMNFVTTTQGMSGKPRAVLLVTHGPDGSSPDLTNALLALAGISIRSANLVAQDLAKFAVSPILEFEFIGLTSRWKESIQQFSQQFDIQTTVESSSFDRDFAAENTLNDLTHPQDSSIDHLVMQYLNHVFDARKLSHRHDS